MGADVKVAQELLRHVNSRITMDLYTQAVSAGKRLASGRQIEMLMGEVAWSGASYFSVPSTSELSLDTDR
jgi:hypothetical protein